MCCYLDGAGHDQVAAAHDLVDERVERRRRVDFDDHLLVDLGILGAQHGLDERVARRQRPVDGGEPLDQVLVLGLKLDKQKEQNDKKNDSV